MLSFALLGCGRIAHRHAELLAKALSQEARLAAVCDVQEPRARAFGEKFNVPWFTEWHEMMSSPVAAEVDVVSVLTPSGLHASQVAELAPYGKHLVVEKPMALTLEGAQSMLEACEEGRVRLFVVLQNRCNRPVMKLREAIEKGRFGKLVMGTVRLRWARSQAYYDNDAWRGTWEMDGGVFANQAMHHLDLLSWLMGEVESVFAMTARRLLNIDVPDTGTALLRFKDGSLGLIEATVATRPRDMEGSISILGEHGVVEIGGFAVNRIKVWEFDEPHPDDGEMAGRFSQNPPDVYGFGHAMFLRHVIRALRAGEPSPFEGKAVRCSLELLHAIHRSAETGTEVRLCDEPRSRQLGKRRQSQPLSAVWG